MDLIQKNIHLSSPFNKHRARLVKRVRLIMLFWLSVKGSIFNYETIVFCSLARRFGARAMRENNAESRQWTEQGGKA
jgi:hypothetical protein